MEKFKRLLDQRAAIIAKGTDIFKFDIWHS